MSQEEIIKRKLLADGEGNGDDRRLVGFYRTFLGWLKTSDSGEIDESTLLKMEVQLQQAECSFEKTEKVFEMNQQEVSHYQDFGKIIDRKIEEAQERIMECKQELQEAKQIRKHKQEYDAMANLIEEHADRTETTSKIAEVRKEIADHEEKIERLQKKMELRKKQFHVLLVSLQELRDVIAADDENCISTEEQTEETTTTMETS